MNLPETRRPGRAEMLAELQAVQIEIAEAADTILSAVESGLACMGPARAGEAAALAKLEDVLSEILGACAFQDLTGQRLAKVRDGFAGKAADDGDGLLNGPALHGQGLDQAGADALSAEIARLDLA